MENGEFTSIVYQVLSDKREAIISRNALPDHVMYKDLVATLISMTNKSLNDLYKSGMIKVHKTIDDKGIEIV